MPATTPDSHPARSPFVALAVAMLLVTALRLAYLAWGSPYALIEDEAHYWEWSRRLDWSYYSKGPGVAWTIAASTALLGTSELGVRAPAALALGVTAWAVGALAWRMFADRRAAWVAAALVLLAPIMQMLALLMTIDGPYLACWALACLAAWSALARRGRWAWVALGACVGAGFLYKYTILLLPPGLAVAMLAMRGRGLTLTPRWGAWAAAGAGLAALFSTPVVVFNAREGWPTVRHLLGHVNAPGGDVTTSEPWRYDPVWTLEFVGGQLLLVGPVLVLAAYCAWELWRRPRTPADRAAVAFGVPLALPMLAFYALLTLVTRVEGNWPVAGYVTLLALCGGGVPGALDQLKGARQRWRALPEPRPRARKCAWPLARTPQLHRAQAWRLTIAYGLIAGVGMLRLDLLTLVPVLGAPYRAGEELRRPIIPMNRLMGIGDIARRVDGLRASLRERTGAEPFVLAQHYGRASQLAFYLQGRPTVYCSSSLMGGRRTQYDYFADTDLRSPAVGARLAGRPAVALGATAGQWQELFASVEPLGVLEGETKPDRESFLALGYRGPAGTGPPGGD